jgi:hypothetical protein
MKEIKLDPRAFFAILAVVVVVAGTLVVRVADAPQKVPLPDPKMFKVGAAKTASHPATP